MMDDQDHDPLDERVAAARPAAPPHLATAVAAGLAARRNRRAAMAAGGAVLAAVALVMLWIRGGPGAPPGAAVAAPPSHAGLARVADAGPGSATVVPADAAPADWGDTPALLATLERMNRAAIAGCLREQGDLDRASGMASFRIERGADGRTRTSLVIHHSIGYFDFTPEERCLQRIAASLVVPPLPLELSSITFTLAPGVAPGSGSAWRDPVREGSQLLASVRPQLEACLRGTGTSRGSQRASAVFESGGGPDHDRGAAGRARFVLRGEPTRAPRWPVCEHQSAACRERQEAQLARLRAVPSCLARIASAIAAPALPDRVEQIVISEGQLP